ncbi:type II toxin-antitoxin system VapC family toxin [Bosea sp. 685]|uniref:type II toxin-antitoxin system VapC family toxin n=1 Tax=Bosea sp. 685 TaxID=3080057 RepID=UPI0028932436|nr:type II toxin-antitoxin system VapC family toxin [Bosea sp. 685]WNJ89676.1 type II toxin-antitoxin system VapC family toxin [Bosea sp. 685]
MRLLLDTHLLLWTAGKSRMLSREAVELIAAPENEINYSVVGLWEVAIKNGLGRSDFSVDLALLRRRLLDNGYREIPVTGEHALATERLPALHRDPFDRLLVAQATVEGMILLTADATLASYGRAVRRV